MSSEFDIVLGAKGSPFHELLPTYYCTFTAGGKKWRTLIHYWTAMFFTNTYIQDWIRSQETPQMAINCAKNKGFTDFDKVDKRYMIYGLQERFNQNDWLRGILLSTGDSNIIYAGRKGFLSDKNRYGRLLMKIREVYQE